MPDYTRTYEQLEQVASKFWPEELSEMEAKISVVPLLLQTQDQFISILNIETPSIDNLFEIIEASALPGNLFLKHLVILSDFGGEMLIKLNNEFKVLFPSREMTYVRDYISPGHRKPSAQIYSFKALPSSELLTERRLGISDDELHHPCSLTDIMRDTIAILLLGGSCADRFVAQILMNCEVGRYWGQPEKLEKFVKQRYHHFAQRLDCELA